MQTEAILHLSDWNCTDKYYQAPIALIEEFKTRIIAANYVLNKGDDSPWQWWVRLVNYGEEQTDKPIQFGSVNMQLDEYFLDWENVQECINEWTDE